MNDLQGMQQPATVVAVNALYNSEGLPPEYIGNPYTEALPGIWTHEEVIQALRVKPCFDESERTFSTESRIHFIARLFWQFFQPMEQHLRIWDYLSICIRQGYIRRNPLEISSVQRANELYAAAMERRKPTIDAKYIPNSVGFAIIGVSGVGKSTAIASILDKYPQVIQHTQYKGTSLDTKQIVWLKLDCSHNGSERGLCLNFLREVDRLVGTRYYESYEKRATVDTLLTEMTRVASAYSLGILLVDECQHLSAGSESRKLLNFFVTLENTIGVPVVLTGTPGALPMLQGDFRSARRCCAHGDIFWNPLQWDPGVMNTEWELFLKQMWRYQWIRNPVAISIDYVKAMYEETQGIEALTVILFILLQEEAIRNESETIRISDIHSVAQKHMKIVQPMLDALRSGDAKKIARYSDVVSSFIQEFGNNHQSSAVGTERPEQFTEKNLEISVAEYLRQMGVAPEQAEKYAHLVTQEYPNEELLKLVYEAILRMHESGETCSVQTHKSRTEAEETAKAEDPDDLRNANSYQEIACVTTKS